MVSSRIVLKKTPGSLSVSILIILKENSDNFLDNLDLNSDELTSDQAYKLRQTISEYSNIFSSRYSGATDLVTHRNNVGDNRPINAAPYRVSPNERRVIDSEWSNACSKTTHHWTIKKSIGLTSSFSIKKGRIYSVLYWLSSLEPVLTKKDVYPLPRLDDSLAAF